VCDTDVFKSDIELLCALEEVRADAVGYGFTLGDELSSVKLSDDSFENFVSDRGEDTLIVVCTKGLCYR
jgi:hypothetical protein